MCVCATSSKKYEYENYIARIVRKTIENLKYLGVNGTNIQFLYSRNIHIHTKIYYMLGRSLHFMFRREKGFFFLIWSDAVGK